jgi:hypothetical protein
MRKFVVAGYRPARCVVTPSVSGVYVRLAKSVLDQHKAGACPDLIPVTTVPTLT